MAGVWTDNSRAKGTAIQLRIVTIMIDLLELTELKHFAKNGIIALAGVTAIAVDIRPGRHAGKAFIPMIGRRIFTSPNNGWFSRSTQRKIEKLPIKGAVLVIGSASFDHGMSNPRILYSGLDGLDQNGTGWKNRTARNHEFVDINSNKPINTGMIGCSEIETGPMLKSLKIALECNKSVVRKFIARAKFMVQAARHPDTCHKGPFDLRIASEWLR